MKNALVVESLLTILCRKLRDSWKTIQILKFNDAETRLQARSDGPRPRRRRVGIG